MKRAREQEEATELAKRQRLDQLTQQAVQYSERILEESDATRKAGLKEELAAVQVQIAQVQIAQEEGDAQKQFDAHLALFKAEKALAKAELEKAIAEAKAEAATATDEDRAYWKTKVIQADKALTALQTAQPTELESKTVELRARFFPMEKSSLMADGQNKVAQIGRVAQDVRKSLPLEKTMEVPVYGSDVLAYVDDGNRVHDIVKNMHFSLGACGQRRTGNISAELIIGHPGIGKTRLANEVARAFSNASFKTDRCVLQIALRDSEVPFKLQPFLGENPSTDLLAAIFVMEFLKLNPLEYTFGWGEIVDRIQRDLPHIRAIVLIVDEFNSDLSISERVLSACGAWDSDAHAFYVLPLFAGVHRARTPGEVYGMTKRLSGSLGSHPTVMGSLGEDARRRIVGSLALSVSVPESHLWNCLGPVLRDCGGWPSFIAVLGTVLRSMEYGPILEQIRSVGQIGSTSGKNLWDDLVKRFSQDINIRRFAELVSVQKERKDHRSERYADTEQNRKSFIVAKLVMERLTLLALTGIEVRLDEPILRLDDDPRLAAEDVQGVTYQLASSMVEMKPLSSDPEFGQVILPVIAVAAIHESFGMKRIHRVLLNPFENSPTVLEVLAVESIYNMLQAHRNLKREEMDIMTLRPASRHWGRTLIVRIPEKCVVVELANHLELDKSRSVSTETNGKGIPVVLQEGVCFTTAVNQKAIDGGAVLAEKTPSKHVVILVSQSKFKMEHVPQTGTESDATIAKAEATAIISAMREQARAIRDKLPPSSRKKVTLVYDVFTTRTIGTRLSNLANPFELAKDEIIFLTTSDCVREALGPVLGVRSTLEA